MKLTRNRHVTMLSNIVCGFHSPAKHLYRSLLDDVITPKSVSSKNCVDSKVFIGVVELIIMFVGAITTPTLALIRKAARPTIITVPRDGARDRMLICST